MPSPATPLLEAAAADFRLMSLSSEELIRVHLDVVVALSFRLGRVPSEVAEELWKTLTPDGSWAALMEADRG